MILPFLTPALLTTLAVSQSAPQMPRVSRKLLPPVDAPGTQGWSKAGLTPEALAARADARLAATKNTIMAWIATMNLPSGNGQSQGRSVLYAPGRYRIEVMRVTPQQRHNELNKLIWMGQSGKTRVLTDAGWQSRPNYRTLPNPLAPAFLTGFDDALMRGTQGAKPVTALLASSRRAGFSALVERRQFGKVTELRLLLTKGATRYAIAWQERQMLPTDVAIQSVNAKGLPTRVRWTGVWGVKSTALTAKDVLEFNPVEPGRPLRRPN